MKLPDKVKIGGHEYKVLFPYSFRERVDLSAQADHSTNEIRIDGCTPIEHAIRPDDRVAVDMLHEIIHCIDSVTGLDELNGGGKEQERIVECLAHGLYQVFHDNQELLKVFR